MKPSIIALLGVFVPGAAFAVDPSAWDYQWLPRADTPSVRSEASIAVDGPARRLYRYGGLPRYVAAPTDLWMMDLEGSEPDWVLVSGNGPPGRTYPLVHVDLPRDRILVGGGDDGNGAHFSDMWSFDRTTQTWTPIAPSDSFPATFSPFYGAAHDTKKDRLLCFEWSSASGTQTIRPWAFDLATDTWSRLPADPLTDSDLMLGGAAFDSSRNRILWCRFDGALWGLDLDSSTWTEFTPADSFPFDLHIPVAVAYDAEHDRLIVPNGRFGPPNHVLAWEFQGTPGWTFLDVPGGPAFTDVSTSGTWDPWARELVVAQSPREGADFVARLRMDAVPSWITLHAAGRPFGRRGMAGAVDDLGRWYVHGGRSKHAEDCGTADSCLSARSSVLQVGEFVSYEPAGAPGAGPGALEGHSAVWDSVGQRVLFFGGRDSAGSLRNGVWALDVSGTPTWSEVATDVPGPPRADHGAAFDRVGRRMYVLSGEGPSGLSNELWSLDVASSPAVWSLVATNLPPVRVLGAGHDRRFERLLFADAINGYALNLSGGSPAVTHTVSHAGAGLPSPGMMVTFDHRRNRLLCQGAGTAGFAPGPGPSSGPSTNAERFVFAFGGADPSFVVWVPTRLEVDGYGLAGYDPVQDRLMVLHGLTRIAGQSSCTYSVHSLRLDPATPTRLDLVEVVATGDGEIRVRFSGEGSSGPVRVERTPADRETWSELGAAIEVAPNLHEFVDGSPSAGVSYRYRGRFLEGSVERFTSPSVAVAIAAPNAGLSLRAPDGLVGKGWPLRLECRLASAGRARLQIVDAAGRSVLDREVVGIPGQPVLVEVQATRAGPGLYFVRLRQGDVAATIRIIRI